jgi:hemoglobin-like flavoprotein
MNPQTIVLVQKSFKVVASIADEVGPMFYTRLFDIRPELRPLFADNVEPQARKLVQMLAMVVNGLHRLDALTPAIEDLARRHVDYGVVAEHYPAVGDALIWTLEKGLGEAFTPPVRHAWVTTYATLSRAMIAATREASGIH